MKGPAVSKKHTNAEDAGAPYFRFIDGLRAIAVLAVVAYHLHPTWLPGGFTGVDVFFVISGFVVSASVAGKGTRGIGEFAATFYARRMRRIVPALLVCLMVTGLASALFIPPAWLSENNYRTGLMAFLGLSNVVLASSSNDYFAPRTEFNPYTHTWSLGVEEQFYLLFPLIFLPWLRGSMTRRVSLGLFAAGLVASLLLAAIWSVDETTRAFYLIFSRFWQLAAGVLLYQTLSASRSSSSILSPRAASTRSFLRRVLVAVSFGLLALGLATARPGHSPWPDGLLPVVGTLGVLASLYAGEHRGWIAALLMHPAMVAIGRLSYSLYLWHWPTFVLFRWTVGLESPLHQVSALAIAFALSAASYRWVELPLRHSKRLASMRRGVLLVSGVVVILVSGYGFAWMQRHQAGISLSVVARERGDWSPDDAPGKPDASGCRVERRSETAGTHPVWVFVRHGCPPPSAPRPRLFVVGDSHAVGYAPLLRQVALTTGTEIRVYHNAGCAFIGLGVAREFEDPRCQPAANAALADVRRLARPGDVLFLPSLRLPRLSDQWARFDANSAKDRMFGVQADAARSAGEAAAVEVLAPLAAAGLRIVFEAPKPVFPAPAYRCSDGFNRDNPVCAGGLEIERREIDVLRAPVLASFERIATQLPGTTIWDPLPTLCPGPTCTAISAGRPVFFDGDHLSGYGNRTLLPSFVAHLSNPQ